jgi:carbonic anhydrase
VQVLYRDAPADEASTRLPADAREALAWLEAGNRRFAGLAQGDVSTDAAAPFVIETDFGVRAVLGGTPKPRPFGLILGCSDSRVPIELVFGRAVNDLFVVRVAGNTAGDDAIASLTYASQQFATAQTIVVLGHTQCGAMATAVEAFLKPRTFLDLAASPPLRALVDRILVSVRAASMVLQETYGSSVTGTAGYPWALLRLTTFLNAAYVAYCVRAAIPVELQRHAVYGVYDVTTCQVSSAATETFAEPPVDAEGFRVLARTLASEDQVRHLLEPQPA